MCEFESKSLTWWHRYNKQMFCQFAVSPFELKHGEHSSVMFSICFQYDVSVQGLVSENAVESSGHCDVGSVLV